jgi:predicted site-specific integrase-resolvase
MPVEIRGQTYYRMLEACEHSGISRATLMRWLKGGVIPEPIKDRRGWRLFSEADLKRIKREAERTY